MIYFDKGNKRYHLRHHNSDDSRTVVECGDVDFKILLRFDSSLNIFAGVFDGPDSKLGRLSTNSNDHYILVKQDRTEIDLGINCRDWHWNDLLKAEVEACKILL